MTKAVTTRHAAVRPHQPRLRARLATAAGRTGDGISAAAATVRTILGHVPGTVDATRSGARDTTHALQVLPDSTLKFLAASSVGIGAGFYLARAPRLAIVAGVAPALVMGAAIALRPAQVIEVEPDR